MCVIITSELCTIPFGCERSSWEDDCCLFFTSSHKMLKNIFSQEKYVSNFVKEDTESNYPFFSISKNYSNMC